MHRNIYYKLLCNYCAYRVGFDSLCNSARGCVDECSNADINGVCQCCKHKPENEKTCPYFRYLAR